MIMINGENVLSGQSEANGAPNDPENAIAQFITRGEREGRLSAENVAEAHHILGEIGSNTEEAPPDQVERLRQLLEEVDASAAAELIDDLLERDVPTAT